MTKPFLNVAEGTLRFGAERMGRLADSLDCYDGES